MAITSYKVNGKIYFRVDFRFANKRQRRGGFRTKRDAEKFLELQKNAANGNLTGVTAASVDDCLSKYLEIISVNKSETLQKLELKWFSKLSVYLRHERKKKFVHEVDLIDLKSYQTDLAKHRSNGTVNRRFDSFKSFFNECVDWGLLTKSPGERLKRLPHKCERRKTWRKDEILKIRDRLPEHFANLFWFIAITGARPSEARILYWRDVDLKGQTVILRSTKGGQGEMIREFPMTGSLISFMKNHFVRQKKSFLAKPSDIVFPSRDGRHFDPTSLQKRVKKIVNKTGLSEGLCVYGLRHSFTTRLIEKDVNLEKVRLLVGHEKITTTQNYAHVDKKSLRVAVRECDLREEIG